MLASLAVHVPVNVLLTLSLKEMFTQSILILASTVAHALVNVLLTLSLRNNQIKQLNGVLTDSVVV